MAAVQAFLTQAPILPTPHPLAVSRTFPSKQPRPRRVGLLVTQPDDGMEIREPTLEESLDAIDDVVMNRLPGEGGLFLLSSHVFVLQLNGVSCDADTRYPASFLHTSSIPPPSAQSRAL